MHERELPRFLRDALNSAIPLSREEEKSLSYTIQNTDSPKEWLTARDKLILSNLRYVPHVIKEEYHPGPRIEYEEMVGAGNLGLTLGAERYDATKGTIFTTYARWWIRRLISEYIQGYAYCAYVPPGIQYLSNNVRELATDMMQVEHDARITPMKVAEKLELDTMKIHASINAMQAIRIMTTDMDIPYTNANDTHENAMLEFLWTKIMRIISELPAIEKDIICKFYGIGCPSHTLREIGADFLRCRERIRQMRNTIIKKLRTELGIEPPPAPNNIVRLRQSSKSSSKVRKPKSSSSSSSASTSQSKSQSSVSKSSSSSQMGEILLTTSP